ncbi:hypothetical protein PMIN01_13534 [Paraphaeosphaeria minitans]|uniref:Uncharacterized protein n=1 Tax=Paraphaeosphaeria minitans TaxID=565426 RepID=A0A9P6G4B8_9PLEO|nr:hypothetical protein PMIN01_13534 [Paraphaeosphaeria minitans]
MSNSTSIREPRISSSTQSSSSAVAPQRAYILRSKRLSDEGATIRVIHEIRKTEAGVDILALVEWGNLLRLSYLDWQETKDRPEVKELVDDYV